MVWQTAGDFIFLFLTICFATGMFSSHFDFFFQILVEIGIFFRFCLFCSQFSYFFSSQVLVLPTIFSIFLFYFGKVLNFLNLYQFYRFNSAIILNLGFFLFFLILFFFLICAILENFSLLNIFEDFFFAILVIFVFVDFFIFENVF